jgi:hypothetical protein
MKRLFGMLVTAALSLILSFASARARGAAVPVLSAAARPDVLCDSGASDLSQNVIENVSLEFPSNSNADLSTGLFAQDAGPTVKFFGSSLNSALLNWSGNELSNDSLTATTTEKKTETLRRATEEPFTSIVNEVPLPLSAWQILIGILTVGIFSRRTPALAPQKVYRKS